MTRVQEQVGSDELAIVEDEHGVYAELTIEGNTARKKLPLFITKAPQSWQEAALKEVAKDLRKKLTKQGRAH